MNFLGISVGDKKVKIAVVSKVRKKLTLERLEEFEEVPHALLNEKKYFVVTPLPMDKVVRRSVPLQLKSKASMMKALPFQLENLLPFSLDETIVFPFFYPQEVVVFATTKSALQNHLQTLHEKGMAPDGVSTVATALAHWIQFVFPEQKLACMIEKNTGIAIENGKIIFSQTLDDVSRLELSLKNKFGYHYFVSNEGSSVNDYSYEKLRAFALPLGLALEAAGKNPCDFRQGEFLAPRKIKERRRWLIGSLAASVGLAIATAAIGSFTLHQKEKELQAKIAPYFVGSGSLGDIVAAWQKKLGASSESLSLQPDIPSVQDALAWLGDFQESIEIVQFRYSLVQYPKAGEKKEPYTAKIDLEFKAASPTMARRFQEALEKPPTLIDKKQKVACNAEKDCYKISFWLRKK